jgi:hypothetical protein
MPAVSGIVVPMVEEVQSELRPARIVRRLAVIAAALGLVHLVAIWIYYGGVVDRQKLGLQYWHISIFDLDEEASFGTWFSAVILLYAGQLLWRHARARRALEDTWAGWWFVLAVGFHVLSVDEVAGMHEYLNTLFKSMPWTTWGAAVSLLVALAYLPFLWHHRWRTSLLFVLAGAIYLGGAVGVERATDWYEKADELNTLSYNLWTDVEELLEMYGVILFLFAILDHMRRVGRTPPVPETDLAHAPPELAPSPPAAP